MARIRAVEEMHKAACLQDPCAPEHLCPEERLLLTEGSKSNTSHWLQRQRDQQMVLRSNNKSLKPPLDADATLRVGFLPGREGLRQYSDDQGCELL